MRLTYEFYLDVFWVTNLVMDGAVMALTAFLWKERVSLRLLLAAAFGATASACLFLLLSSYMGYQLILHLIVNPAMVLIGFSWKGPRAFLRNFLGAYVISIGLGGCVSWLWPMVGRGGFFWLWAAAGAFICGLVVLGARIRARRRQLYEVLLVAQGQKLSLKGFLDTGNLLWDPMLQKPVHIIERELLPEKLRESPKIHYIPFHSLGNEKGMLPAVVVEGMYIRENTKGAGNIRYIEKPVCGMAEKSLFSGRPYQMILHGTTIE